MKSKITWIAVLLAPWLVAASLPASASVKYDNATGTCVGPSNGLLTSCTPTTPSGGTSLTETAISNTGAGGLLAAAYLGKYGGGLGVSSAGETLTQPEHAMDNAGNFEMILLSFGSSVSLGAAEFGYFSGDSDITVLAYTGCLTGQTCTSALVGDTYGGLVGNTTGKGWSLVGNYANTVQSPSTVTINAYSGAGTPTVASVSSSYWLIGAYNNSFGTTATDPNTGSLTNGTLGTGNDYVKLLAVYGNTTPVKPQGVPEPSSLLLVVLALLGVTELRRRRAVI